ncbi:MAG: hypothetical protein EZS28_003433 [Streblomastix strix]|uniref:Uncharacterized protein n=1 Tax=Streblomastix strix TaxID=222440 RepID=A0A5J4X1I4_9EUKA|nr:MAG: hypothetical protein EZS28_003433 [Streblomastix strix]
MGIADTSCYFAAGKEPSADGNDKKTVRYWNDGSLDHISSHLKGNQEYSEESKMGIEVDLTTVPRKVTFFIDDIEQPNYVVGIPSEIRFLVHFTEEVIQGFQMFLQVMLIMNLAKGDYCSMLIQGKDWFQNLMENLIIGSFNAGLRYSYYDDQDLIVNDILTGFREDRGIISGLEGEDYI